MIQIFISKLLINNNNNGRIVGIDKHCTQNKQRMFSLIKKCLNHYFTRIYACCPTDVFRGSEFRVSTTVNNPMVITVFKNVRS